MCVVHAKALLWVSCARRCRVNSQNVVHAQCCEVMLVHVGALRVSACAWDCFGGSRRVDGWKERHATADGGCVRRPAVVRLSAAHMHVNERLVCNASCTVDQVTCLCARHVMQAQRGEGLSEGRLRHLVTSGTTNARHKSSGYLRTTATHHARAITTTTFVWGCTTKRGAGDPAQGDHAVD